MKYSVTRIYKLTVALYNRAKRVCPAYSSKFSKKTYTLHQHIVLLSIREYRNGMGYERFCKELPDYVLGDFMSNTLSMFGQGRSPCSFAALQCWLHGVRSRSLGHLLLVPG